MHPDYQDMPHLLENTCKSSHLEVDRNGEAGKLLLREIGMSNVGEASLSRQLVSHVDVTEITNCVSL